MNKKKHFINISVFIFALLTCLIDAIIKPNYFIKIPIKVIFFFALPTIFFLRNKKDFEDFKKLFKFKKDGLLKALFLGLLIYIIIIFTYFITKNIIDYSNVTKSLTTGMQITKFNFIYAATYIALINSFLEEFFFRGYGFITLKRYSNRRYAYLSSSIAFASYHIGMLLEMFNIYVLIFLLISLIFGGCLFNYLNEKNNNIYSSWFVHMFTNFAINSIGLILFGIV